jgi:hypothetical protein
VSGFILNGSPYHLEEESFHERPTLCQFLCVDLLLNIYSPGIGEKKSLVHKIVKYVPLSCAN